MNQVKLLPNGIHVLECDTHLSKWIGETARQLDCISMWGTDYPPQCSPHLGVFIRNQ